MPVLLISDVHGGDAELQLLACGISWPAAAAPMPVDVLSVDFEAVLAVPTTCLL